MDLYNTFPPHGDKLSALGKRQGAVVMMPYDRDRHLDKANIIQTHVHAHTMNIASNMKDNRNRSKEKKTIVMIN